MTEQQKFEAWADAKFGPAPGAIPQHERYASLFEVWQARAAQDKSAELAAKVLAWWEEHQYDTYSTGEDEHNTYDTTPDFVVMAQQSLMQGVSDGATPI